MAEGQGGQENDEPGNSKETQMESVDDVAANGIPIDSMVQAYSNEYANLDHTLDEIDTWMNKLEQQNDTLYAELDTLMESSRQARAEIEEIRQQESTTSPEPVTKSEESEKPNS